MLFWDIFMSDTLLIDSPSLLPPPSRASLLLPLHHVPTLHVPLSSAESSRKADPPTAVSLPTVLTRTERALSGGDRGLDSDLGGDRLLLVAATGVGLARRRGLDVEAVRARSGWNLWHKLEAEAAEGHAERL
jgi:hypothetical protein